MSNPRLCMHRMVFAERFCVCKNCGQVWELGQFGWKPDDPDYKYRKRPQRGGNRGYRKRK